MPHYYSINIDVDAGTETIFPGGGVWLPPTAARVHAVVSASVNDAAAGTGARTVEVTGYTSTGVLATETVTMDGTTPVNTTGSYIDIVLMRVATAGSTGINEGAITATAATDSTITAAIALGHNVSSRCVAYSQEVGEQLEVVSATISQSNATAGDIEALLVYRRSGESLVYTIPLGGTLDTGSTVLSVPVGLILRTGDFARLDVTSSAANSRVLGSLHVVKRA